MIENRLNTFFNSVTLSCVVALVLVSCKPKIHTITADKGMVNPDRVLMLGGGAIAGYTDGALSEDGQLYSVAALLSQQLQTIGSPAIIHPLVATSSVGMSVDGKSKMKLDYKTDCKGVTALSPIRIASIGDASIFSNIYVATNPFTNLGVPFLKASNLNDATFASSDQFFGRITSTISSSLLTNAVALNSTFFTLMIGEGDVLDFAMKGGVSASLVSTASFETDVNTTVNALIANGARGVLTNIPDVTQYPYFTTIPWNGLTLDAAKAASLNNALGSFGFGTYVEGANPFIINDALSPAGFRWIKEGELILLGIPLDSIKCYGMGSTSGGLPEKYVLTLDEIAQIKSSTAAYNSSLSSIASTKGLAFADINALFGKLPVGFPVNGVSMSSKFVSGGVFSLDGLNLTPRGNALVTNEIIKAINSSYNSTIKPLDVTSFRGVIFP